MSLFDDIGGFETLRRINKVFYDKVYAHPWIGLYFRDFDQKIIEKQQTDFIAQSLGGPGNYRGKSIIAAHGHMFLPNELFELRESLLQAAFQETHAPEVLIVKWNKIDRAFKTALVSQLPSECTPRFPGDTILNFPNPAEKRG